MQYFLLGPGAKKSEAILLGEVSFNTFYTEPEFGMLNKMVESYPDLISEIKIIDNNKNTLTIEEFLSMLEKLTVILL